jgi:hypothetical protein
MLSDIKHLFSEKKEKGDESGNEESNKY